MNAIQFIKDHGVDKAREVVEGAPEGSTHLSGFTGQIYKDSGDVVYVWDGMKYHKSIYEHTRGMILLSDLKRLVDSLDLVKSYGGIINAKYDVKHLDLDWDYDTPRVTRLKLAIADYESIGGEHV